jgi:ParB-like chromosome segregation protein Spo0J
MKVQEIDINLIKPYKNNPREISKEAIAKVKTSIKEFGNNQPIVIDQDNIIVVGHTRWKALKSLNKKTAFVLKKTFEKNQARAYRIMDNRSSEENKWETKLLKEELDLLKISKFDLDLTGFTLDEINQPMHQIKMTDINLLKPHPKNYKEHPKDQLQHLCKSIKENGVYRNVIIAKDKTILAGHGIVLACKQLKIQRIKTLELNIKANDPKAIKLLVVDNEVNHLGEIDDRALSGILKEILNTSDLLGTGYDEMKLANLLLVSRPKSEILDFNEAAEWVGMPDFEHIPNTPSLIVHFRNIKDKLAFQKNIDSKITEKTKSVWWPFKERDDLQSLKYDSQ